MLYFIEENDKFKLYRSDLIFRGRDFVVLKFKKNNKIQPFYRSTGRNSGKPDTWFPFDGIIDKGYGRLWFNKRRFIVDGELDRYGTEQHRLISNHLAELNIERGHLDVDYPDYEKVNQELGIHEFVLAEILLGEVVMPKNNILKILKEKGYKNGLPFSSITHKFAPDLQSTIKAILALEKEGLVDFYLNITCPICNQYIEVKKNYSRYVKDECPHCGRAFTLSLKDTMNHIELKKGETCV